MEDLVMGGFGHVLTISANNWKSSNDTELYPNLLESIIAKGQSNISKIHSDAEIRLG